jgi:uncharacterized protein (DUF1015 family)
MCDVRPFRGFRYNLERIGDLSSVICPPHDEISPQAQHSYYLKSPYNIVRLELGKESPGDSPGNNKYTRAADTLQTWLREGILLPEERPAFYLIEQRFPYKGTMRSLWGLIARVGLEDWGGQIRPHEMIRPEPAADRLRLLQHCRFNFSPVMGLFRREKEGLLSLFTNVTADRPALSAADSSGVTCNVWLVTEEKMLKAASDFFATRVIYIADGHHRYQTALTYRRQQIDANPSFTGDEAFNFVMMTLIDSQDSGLIMLPTHHLVRGLEPERLARLREELTANFEVIGLLPPSATPSQTAAIWLHALEEQGHAGMAFGLYGLHGPRICLMVGKGKAGLQKAMPHSEVPGKGLGVSVLHWLTSRGLLVPDSPQREQTDLTHTRDPIQAISWVDSGEFQLAFFLNPVAISTVLAVADAGGRMPQKSTYFYPKTPAGLVTNSITDAKSSPFGNG